MWKTILTALLALGDRLPQVLELLQRWYDDWVEVIGEPEDVGTFSVDAEEEALEQRVLAACAQEGVQIQAWDGTRLRKLFGFLRSNPELIGFLIGLIRKG